MVEFVPKPAKRAPVWQDILFYLAIVLLLLAVFSYLGLNYYQKKAEATLEDLENRLANDENLAEISVLEKEVLVYQGKIKDFSTLLDEHKYASKLFATIESITHPEVKWSSFELDNKNFNLSLSGKTENFQTLEQQILILKEKEFINNLQLLSMGVVEERKINFRVNFNFDPIILK